MKAHDSRIHVTDDVVEHLVNLGFNEKAGGRKLEEIVKTHIVDEVVTRVFDGGYVNAESQFFISLQDRLTFKVTTSEIGKNICSCIYTLTQFFNHFLI